MSTKCSICGDKIGTFDDYVTFTSGSGDQYNACGRCKAMKEPLHMSNIDPRRTSLIERHNKAVNWFIDSNPSDDALYSFARIHPEDLPSMLIDVEQAMKDAEVMAADAALRTAENRIRFETDRDSIIATTGCSFDGYKVTEYHGVVSHDCIIGSGMIADAGVAISGIAGEKSELLAEKVKRAKCESYEKLLERAVLMDGNAVLGISYYVYVLASNMIGVSCTGTSVTIEDDR